MEQRFSSLPEDKSKNNNSKKTIAIVAIFCFIITIGIAVGMLIIAGVVIFAAQESKLSAGLDLPSLGDKIGIIEIEGAITSSKDIVDGLEKFRESRSIKAIIIRINSPGGAVSPSQDIYESVKRIRNEGKLIVASFGSVAASGGYYAACAANKIFSSPGTLTGSIGVYLWFMHAEDLLNKIGIKSETIKSGELKDAGSFAREMTETEKNVLQLAVDDIYEQFVEDVAECRLDPVIKCISEPIPYATNQMNSSEVNYLVSALKSATNEVDLNISLREIALKRMKTIADGRVLTGRQALRLGLVDRLGTLDDAIKYVAKETGMIGAPKTVRYKKPLPGFFSSVSEKISKYINASSPPIQYRMPYSLP